MASYIANINGRSPSALVQFDNIALELITYGFALLVLIVLGPLSDQIGRKPVLVYNLLFAAISFGARAYVIYADLDS
jgi:MFS family permease